MTHDSDNTALTRWLGYSPQLEGIVDKELLTLKLHLISEDALRHLLAMRLGVDEQQLSGVRLGFDALAHLALAGEKTGLLLQAMLALNAARNKAAHAIDDAAFVQNIDKFVAIVETIAGGSLGASPVDRLRMAGETAIVEVFDRASKYWT